MKSTAALLIVPALCACSLPARAQVVLYEEDFEDGAADGFIFSDDWWWVSDGSLHCYQEGMEIFSMGYVPGPGWSDYTYNIDLRVYGSINHMIRFRIQSEDDFYELNLRAYPYADAFLQKYENGIMTILAGVSVSTQSEEWHRFSIRLYGPRIEVELDSAPLLLYEDESEPYLWGGVGMACFTGGVIHWQHLDADNIRVTVPVIPSERMSWGRIKDGYRSRRRCRSAQPPTSSRASPDAEATGYANVARSMVAAVAVPEAPLRPGARYHRGSRITYDRRRKAPPQL